MEFLEEEAVELHNSCENERKAADDRQTANNSKGSEGDKHVYSIKIYIFDSMHRTNKSLVQLYDSISAADYTKCEEVKVYASRFLVPESEPSAAVVHDLTAREAEGDIVFASFVMLCGVVCTSVHA